MFITFKNKIKLILFRLLVSMFSYVHNSNVIILVLLMPNPTVE
jgi:hypothetical protein